MPTWGDTALLNDIDFDNIRYFVKAGERTEQNWDDVPDDIKRTFDRLGIPEAERKFLSRRVGAVRVRGRVPLRHRGARERRRDLLRHGHGAARASRDRAEVPRRPSSRSKTTSSPRSTRAVWSGGSFVYVPKGVEVKMPLQAYFRINTENMGQFERTLIIADEGSKVHYIEGCTAPQFSTSSLHSAVVELIAMEGASIRYTTIQNWYRNIYNLVTKRAVAYKNATVEWVDGNIGSRLTMKYPAIYLMGEGARGEILSAAFAGEGQHQDAGAKVIHAAPNTTSVVTNKSVTAHGGKTTYRGLVEIHAARSARRRA